MLDNEQVRLTICGRFTLEQVVRRKLSVSVVVLKASCLSPSLKRDNETLSWWAAAYTA